MIKSILVSLSLLGSAPSAFAMWEVRANFGQYSKTPTSFNSQMEDYVRNAPDLQGPIAYGVDGIFRAPILPLMVGLRYESLGLDKSGAASISGTAVQTSTKFTGSRSSLLAGWQLFGIPGGHLTLIGHYAFQQNAKYTMSSTNAGGSTNVDSFTGVMKPGYGAGLEAGLKIGYVVVATEIGYSVFKSKEFTLNGEVALDDSSKRIEMDLSGTYFRVAAGVGF